MRALILQRPGSTAPFERWILDGDPTAEVTILTGSDSARDPADVVPGVDRRMVAGYAEDEGTAALLQICESWHPDRIFSNSEDDVLRAAEARMLFGIAGQQSRSALLFRDKVRMKSILDGLPVPPVPHAEVQCVQEVLEALTRFGRAVLKPRNGAGSVGVHVLHSLGDVRQTCSADVLRALHDGRLMVEQYVPGTVYHVDIVADRDRCVLISPSRYRHPPHLFREHPVASIMLDETSHDYDVLTQLAEQFVAHLPEGHGANLMHLEVYKDASGRWFSGEVACRGGGGLVKQAIMHTYGVDVAQLSCLLGTGLPLPAASFGRRSQPAGMYLGTTSHHPRVAARPVDGIVLTVEKARDADAQDSVDAAVSFVVAGSDEEEIGRRMQLLDASA